MALSPAERDPIRFSLETLHNKACGAVERTLRRGIAGKIPREKAASVALGLKAATVILDRTAPLPKASEIERGPVTVNVAIFSSEAHAAGYALTDHGNGVRFVGGNGAES